MPTANTLLSAPELNAEGLEPHDVSEVYLAAAVSPTVWVPLTQQDVERKIASLRAHASQMGDWDPEPMVREWLTRAAQQAREHGVDCEFAEAFAYVRLHAPEEEQPANTEPT
jgi:LmbE family N-acetylglucosaminyl deacetylase